jgi:hypothetical protein
MSPEDRERKRLIAFIERCAKEVARWPRWMVGKPDPKRRKASR